MHGGAADAEPSWATLRAHSGRLFRRARRHVWIVFGAAALATLATLFVAARRPVRQTATVVLRMTEDLRAPLRLPWTDRELRGYVNEVALSQTQLLTLIDRHHMFRGKPGKFDPILAVETFRERILVDVVQNHAIALVERDNRPRSAHVKISYEDGDPERAVTVARELGELLVATGQSQQRQQAEAAMQLAAAELEAARAALQRLRVQAASAWELVPIHARTSADVPGMHDAVAQAQGRVDRAEEGLVGAQRRLRGELEPSGLDLQPPPWPVAKKLAVVAAMAGLVCFPLAALMVGAWDRRIYASEDIRHLGLRCLGHLGLTKEEA